MPAWGPELGGHSVGEEAALWIKLRFARLSAPKMPNPQGPGVVATGLLQFGDEQQRELIRPVVRGDTWWCLGMSEREAGSDLASLRTTAEPDGDGFVINGQQVWTSHAHQASHCMLFARTGTLQDRHRGITAFVLPMETPGITARRIEKIGARDEEFCEVFLSGVGLPRSALLGSVGGGWKVAMAGVTDERDMIWIMNLVEVERGLQLVRCAHSAARSAPCPRISAGAGPAALTTGAAARPPRLPHGWPLGVAVGPAPHACVVV
jgi:alkylation response protein AidB-like acyl-CoA dehydrogenase